MAKSREDSTRDVYVTVGAKNNERLLLLVSIKSFNLGVEKIRKEFGIVPEKYQDPPVFAADQWYEVNKQEKFNPAFRLPGSTKFQEAVNRLCKRYNVPQHFYNMYLQGVPLYIISGVISTPTENWQYVYSDKAEGSTGFKFYAPLTQAELLEFNRVLTSHFAGNHNSNNQKAQANRERKQFMRDWELIMPLVNRVGQPKRIKQYESGSYLAAVSKDKSISKKKLTQLEKLHPDSIVVVFDQPTAAGVAKGKRLSAASIRQAKLRLNAMAKQLYNHSLEE